MYIYILLPGRETSVTPLKTLSPYTSVTRAGVDSIYY